MSEIRIKRVPDPDQRCKGLLVWLMLAVAGLGTSCFQSDPAASKPAPNRAIPVTIASIVQKDAPLELETFGTAQSKASVTIKAQVAQVIRTVHFQEGQEITRGDLLFTLDSRPYEVALARARATLARDQVLSDDAQLEARRNADLLDKKVLSQEDYDNAKSTADALAETLKADQAEIDSAQIDLDNCRIVSPIAGRAGKLLVHAGNLVAANDVPLVTINQIQPIDVFFSLPQAELDRIRNYQKQGELTVEAALPDDPDHPEKGFLQFIDNRIDSSNGTIELGATLPNPDERLWPGRYVRVRLVLLRQHDAIVAPLRAIVTGSTGQYVFVVKDGQTVEQRPVKVARTVGEDAILEAGLQPGEQVVTDGQLQLEDGTAVEIASGGVPSATPAPAAPAGEGAAP